METQTVRLPLTPPARNRFDARLLSAGLNTLTRGSIDTLQINVGKLCNQACKHCHVEAGPKRTEIMERRVLERLVELAAHPALRTVDITGGAPEMNPFFRELVRALTALGKAVTVRCNLTILRVPGYAWLPEFYAQQRVHLIASLPCYTLENVEQQRGRGVFADSIAALQTLNALGYGVAAHPAGLRLDLVYNPGGAFLPPAQAMLEADYRRELGEHFGIHFSHLLTLANMPIGRYAADLRRSGALEGYMELLDGAFNAATLPQLMCRNTLNVGWDGRIYDCDFNQMLELELGGGKGSILDAQFSLERLGGIPVQTREHCLGCTAGSGSSCGGVLT